MKTIRIELAENSYKVYVGQGIFSKLSQIIFRQKLAANLFIVLDSQVKKLYSDKLKSELEQIGTEVNTITIKATEKNKSVFTLEKIYTALLKKNYSRDTLIISIGGGIVGDIAGLAASTFARGVQYIQIPTTLLAAVDSAVGGKTGINFFDTKNIVGSFYQPKFVIVDTDFFKSLAAEEMRCGLGEILKYAYLTDRVFFNYIRKNIENIFEQKENVLTKVISTAVKYKGDIVSKDEKEKGLRKVLNLGHTFAHAIEVEQEFRLKHGEAVIVGIACSLYLSNKLGLIDDDKLSELLSPLIKFQKLISIRSINFKKIRKIMLRDKKNKQNRIKFVLVKDVGEIIIDVEASEEDINYSLENGIGLFATSAISKI
jgi:3-dehydroquinate synthase